MSRTRFSLLAALLVFSVQCGLSPLQTRADEKQKKPPKIGQEAPDFELSTIDGKKLKLSKLVKEGPVVVILLRGYPTYQCPVCSKQVGSFVKAAKQFDREDATIVMIYPDTADGIDEHSKEFMKGKKLSKNVKFLLDPDFTFTNSYGLRWEGKRETSYPSTFIIDKDRNVKYSKISRTHGGRSKPKDVLAALKKK